MEEAVSTEGKLTRNVQFYTDLLNYQQNLKEKITQNERRIEKGSENFVKKIKRN